MTYGHVALLCTVSLLPWVTGYSTGPPTVDNPNICSTMNPTEGHYAEAMNPATASEFFQVIVAGNCYKPGMNIPVYIRVTPERTQRRYIQGLFVMARNMTANGPDVTSNFGTFSTEDPYLQGLPCYNRTDSSIGQAKVNFWRCKTFMWKIPADETVDVPIVFQATVVLKRKQFWIDVRSATITYSSDCPEPSKDHIKCDTSDGEIVWGKCSEGTSSAGNDVTPKHVISWLAVAMAMMFKTW